LTVGVPGRDLVQVVGAGVLDRQLPAHRIAWLGVVGTAFQLESQIGIVGLVFLGDGRLWPVGLRGSDVEEPGVAGSQEQHRSAELDVVSSRPDRLAGLGELGVDREPLGERGVDALGEGDRRLVCDLE
jgi:hypothetical protein